jgi:hypothetical protein
MNIMNFSSLQLIPSDFEGLAQIINSQCLCLLSSILPSPAKRARPESSSSSLPATSSVFFKPDDFSTDGYHPEYSPRNDDSEVWSHNDDFFHLASQLRTGNWSLRISSLSVSRAVFIFFQPTKGLNPDGIINVSSIVRVIWRNTLGSTQIFCGCEDCLQACLTYRIELATFSATPHCKFTFGVHQVILVFQ